MLSKSKVSKGYLTVVPKAIREASEVREGDILEWSLEGARIVVRPRRRRTVDDLEGLIEGAMPVLLGCADSLSVADCASVAVMARRGIRTIVSFDRDFDKVRGIRRIR